jgi:hypothetical protein
MTQFLWVLGAVAAAALVAAVYWTVLFWPRRRQQWEQAAGRLGLTVSEGPALHERFAALDYFRQGRARRTRVLLEGDGWRGRVFVGDHVYTTGSGRHSSQHHHTVCVVQNPRLALPHFSLRREPVLVDRIAELLGGVDIDFPEDPDFSRAFRLLGDDEAAVRRLFSAAVRHFFLHTVGTRVVVEGRGDLLLVHRGQLVRPEEASALLQQAQELAQHLGG